MTDSIKTVLIKDARIADINSVETYAVQTSGSQITANVISATSKSTSSLVFSIQLPSENIVMDRNVLLRANVNFTIEINAAGNNVTGVQPTFIGETCFSYGTDNSFQAYPLNALFTTSSGTINNCNVSVNLRDVLPQLVLLNDARDLCKYNNMTPCYPDSTYATFTQGVGTSNNALGNVFNNSLDVNFNPRGAFPLANFQVVHNWVAGGVQQTDASLVCVTGLNTEKWTITIDALLTEPLMGLSPFIFGDPEYNAQGLLGINNMSLVFNIGDLQRFWSCARGNISNIFLNNNSFTTCELLLTYLSLQPTDVVETKNIVPYIDTPRFISNSTVTLPAFVPPVIAFPAVPPTPPISFQIVSNSIQLSSIPDKFIICVRKQMSQQTTADSNSFMCISNIIINFNNSSGLLANFSQEQLWRMSVKAGSNQSWNAFSGFSNGSNATGTGQPIATIGSLLVIPADQLSLPNYLCSGSQGNFNFQYTVTCYNTQQAPVPVELVLICANSGIMINQQGVSNLYTGLLGKEVVLKTCEEQSVDPVSSVEYNRMIGGAYGNRPLTAMHKLVRRRRGGVQSGGESSGGSMAQLASSLIANKIINRKKKTHNLI
jgi:hypothetical protein